MRLIAHRGNLRGPDPARENSLDYIDEAIVAGFDVEVDLWDIDGRWWLGHDGPVSRVGFLWLRQRRDSLWCHCKDAEMLYALTQECWGFNAFWHDKDDHALTSRGYIWSLPGRAVTDRSIVVDLTAERVYHDPSPYGVCTDYPYRLRP